MKEITIQDGLHYMDEGNYTRQFICEHGKRWGYKVPGPFLWSMVEEKRKCKCGALSALRE